MPQYRILSTSTWQGGRERTSTREISVDSDEKALIEYNRLIEEAKWKDARQMFFETPHSIMRIDVREVTTDITPPGPTRLHLEDDAG